MRGLNGKADSVANYLSGGLEPEMLRAPPLILRQESRSTFESINSVTNAVTVLIHMITAKLM